jgi:hypothetical protein
VKPWLPRLPSDADSGAGARIRVAAGATPAAASPIDPPTLRLAPVSAWVRDEGRSVVLVGSGDACRGRIDLAGLRADVHVDGGASAGDVDGADLYSMLTLSAALLLGRMGASLVHAGAVVASDGRAWLLVGDSFAGKSTTCASLIRQGWDYLSDDQVVLREAGDGGIRVEGWPRTFHLDEGWESGTPLHRRRGVSPEEIGPGCWRRSAPLGGVLFPYVAADAPTSLLPLARSAALGELIRQSPWLMADREAARPLLELLRRAATKPVFRLRLGLDTYRDAAALPDRLRSLEHQG